MHYSANAGATLRRLMLLSVLSLLVLLGFALGPSRAGAAEISITGGPAHGGFSQGNNVVFSLQATVPVANPVDFGCSMDNPATLFSCHNVEYPTCVPQGATKSCTQSITYPILAEGLHNFHTAAMDCNAPCELEYDGEIGPVATRSFFVDRTPAAVTLVRAPSVSEPVRRGKPTFSFWANETVTYTCSTDGEVPVPCRSPVTLNRISNGRHSISIVGTDRAGNVSTPLVRTYAVDVFKPKTCKKGKSKKAKAKYKKCAKANARAKAKWRARGR